MTGGNHRDSIRPLLTALVVLFLSGCSTNAVQLTYDTSAVASQPAAAASSVEIMSVGDNRTHDPYWLGAIRGGFGNPLKTLTTDVPVKDVVENTFTAALNARGLLASTGGVYGMQVVINQFDCNQYVRREAHVRLHISMVELASGQQIYAKDIRVDKVVGSRAAGIFAAVEDLRKLANQALQEAVDQALDDPKFNETVMAGT
jgi:uncharacterized lipoprotein YajG